MRYLIIFALLLGLFGCESLTPFKPEIPAEIAALHNDIVREEKAVTRDHLAAVYDALTRGRVTRRELYQLVGSARPCNVTTITWMLREFGLASEDPDGVWRAAW